MTERVNKIEDNLKKNNELITNLLSNKKQQIEKGTNI